MVAQFHSASGSMVATGHKPLVCVLEDDAAVRDSLRLMLERNGYSVQTFNSPNDFLLTKEIDRFNCLVLDFQLPGMNGLELLELLRLRAYSKPAILIAAGPDPQLASRMKKVCVIDFLRKPIAPDTLLGALRTAIGDKSGETVRLRT
ncbi:MAG: response regulator transcription factor [Rhizomicrobium sp.]